MSDIDRKINVLGICGSPRKNGNSQYLLNQALAAAADAYVEWVEITQYSISGKKFSPCVACFKCAEEKHYGECVIEDDFQELRDRWLNADVIIYSVPVYHMHIPGQLKCFIDRLGNTINRRFRLPSPRFLKVIGSIAQGSHFSAGQELAVSFLIQHAVLKNCIPVSGDGWQSYIGACGWTQCEREKDAIERHFDKKNQDAEVAVTASMSLAKRAVELALIVQQGGLNLKDVLSRDAAYKPFIERLGSE
jgi:multimeric flavodoxin WrbA